MVQIQNLQNESLKNSFCRYKIQFPYYQFFNIWILNTIVLIYIFLFATEMLNFSFKNFATIFIFRINLFSILVEVITPCISQGFCSNQYLNWFFIINKMFRNYLGKRIIYCFWVCEFINYFYIWH